MRFYRHIVFYVVFVAVSAAVISALRARVAYLTPVPETLKKDFAYKSVKGAWLERANLRGVRLHQSAFFHSSLNDADLTSVRARGMQLVNVQLNRAVFRGADLRGMKSFQSSWRNADLRGADLRGSDFYQDVMSSCDLRGADLRDAVFLPSTLEGAVFDSTTRLPFSREVALMKGMKDVTGREATSQSSN